MGLALGIDLGTSGPKVALVGVDGRVAACEIEPIDLQLLPDGGAEQDPRDWWRAIGRASRRLLASVAIDPTLEFQPAVHPGHMLAGPCRNLVEVEKAHLVQRLLQLGTHPFEQFQVIRPARARRSQRFGRFLDDRIGS